MTSEARPMTRLTRCGMSVAIGGGLLALAPAMAEGYNLIKLVALAAGGCLIWVGLFRTRLRNTSLDLPLAALWLVMLVSALQSVDPPASVLGQYPQAFYGLVPLSLCAALFYAAAQIDADREKDEALRWLLFASIPLTLFGISQRFMAGSALLLYPPLMNNRIMSTIGAPVMFGACLVPLSAIALHWTLEKRGPFGKLCAALIAVALLMTWSRGAWFSAAAGASAYLWLTGRLSLSKRQLLVLVLLVPVCLVVLQRALKKGQSDAIRIESVKSSLAAIASRPLLGFGPDAFEFAFRRFRSDEMVRVTHDSASIQSNAHNDLLQVAVTLGALGLLAYGWLLWALGARLFALLNGPEIDRRAAAVAAALFGLFIQAKVNPVPPAGLLIAALLAGLVCGGRKLWSPGASRAGASLTACFCAIAAVFLTRFCAADVIYKTGYNIVRWNKLGDPVYMDGVKDLRRATELNPLWLDYLSARCDVILSAADVAPPAAAKLLAVTAMQLTADAVRLHPGNGTAHFMRATVLAFSAVRLGARSLPEAFAEIKTASELDPTFTYVMRRRMEIDHARGDQKDYEQVDARYRQIIAVAGESAPWTPLFK